MKVLVVGSGGREHAIAWKLKQSPRCSELYCAPGNGGTADIAYNVDFNPENVGALALWAVKQGIDLTVVGPEAPLAAGIVDVFNEHGLRAFGPSKAAAQLETSKAYAKEIMLASGVRTAESDVFDDHEEALAYLKEKGAPIVIKADGLAAGKGVAVCKELTEAEQFLKEAMLDERFKGAGTRVVIEEFLAGCEASVMTMVDGEAIIPFAVSQDYKRLKDGDEGPNTGGMGAISPTSNLEDERAEAIVREVFIPVVRELKSRGITYKGFLYAGVMIEPGGLVKVLEFNCRLGDPETQALMVRLQSDLLVAIEQALDGNLATTNLTWTREATACVVASSAGYPGAVDDGKLIEGIFTEEPDSLVFQAGTVVDPEDKSKRRSKGGRVLSVVGRGATLGEAVERAYNGMNKISFEGMFYRKDIGK